MTKIRTGCYKSGKYIVEKKYESTEWTVKEMVNDSEYDAEWWITLPTKKDCLEWIKVHTENA